MFSFQAFAEPSYIYDNTYWICSFTTTSFILILINNLHTVKKLKTFPVAPSDICGFATSTFDLVLSWGTAPTPTPTPTISDRF